MVLWWIALVIPVGLFFFFLLFWNYSLQCKIQNHSPNFINILVKDVKEGRYLEIDKVIWLL